LALCLTLRGETTPGSADLPGIWKDHDVPKPCLEFLDSLLTPTTLEGTLEELADRDEGHAQDPAADVFL